MTTVAEARAAMLGAIKPGETEHVALEHAVGRTLRSPVHALRSQPPFAASAMDGYALRSQDAPGKLRIVGEAAAGRAFGRALNVGEAVRISTGAPLPEKADTILIQEDARITADGTLEVDTFPAGRHVRPAGADFVAGTRVLAAGRSLDPVAVALAAAAGAAKLVVAKRPLVTILYAGDEIAPPGCEPRADQIFESCSYAIGGLVNRWGGDARRVGPLADDPRAIEGAAGDAMTSSDLVVFIGSASVGPHDHAKPAFERLGARFLVRKVDMRPGKPTWFATTTGAPVLGLPGNPASALVAAALFLRPALAAMQGGASALASLRARLSDAIGSNGPREAFLRATVGADTHGQNTIKALPDQDSSLLLTFATANALLIRPPNAAAMVAGEEVDYLPWLD